MEAAGRLPAAATTFLLLLFFLPFLTSAATSSKSSSTYYIKRSCTKATYPSLCYSSLSPYASTVQSNPWKLCGSALQLSLDYARKAKTAFSSMSKSTSLNQAEKAAVKQCRDNMADSVDQLRQSVRIMSSMIRAKSSSSSSYSSSDVEFQMSNVKTYVSSAITDDDTCQDGLEEEKVRASLKKQILKWESAVEKLTSNALSLVNTLKY